MLGAARDILREPDTPLDLRKVAERAGKSRTAPYLVFGKESEGGGVLALRIAVAAEGARDMADAMEEAADGVGDPVEALDGVALAFLDFVEREPRLFRLMYGPEINAVSRIGEEGFRSHPEFSRLLRHRSRAGAVVSELIRRGQDRGLLTSEAPGEHRWGDVPDDGFLETPRSRYLQIVWSTMIGVALLRDDQLLRAIDWVITREQAARLIVESVFGLDPLPVRDAARTLLRAHEAHLDLDAPLGPPPTVSEPAVGEDAGVWHVVAESRSAPFEAPAPESFAPDAAAPRPVPLGEALDRFPGLRRAAYSNRMRSRPRILWIDDHPEWIEDEVATLRHLGAEVVLARTTHEAVGILTKASRGDAGPVRVIVSDIARGSREDAGLRALPELAHLAPGASVIFFVAHLDEARGVPPGAAGITDRMDELLHLVVDALEGR